MKSKGFTLFTALIAFVLIVLSLILVQSMISTERTASDVVSDISGQERMQALADLARADSLQSFNYGVRELIERHSTEDSSGDGLPDDAYIEFIDGSLEWDDMTNLFIADRFGVGVGSYSEFANRVALHLNTLLSHTADSRGYTINVQVNETTPMQATLQQGFDAQVSGGGIEDFFEIINCDGTFSGCPQGTFYVTMDLSPSIIQDADYEKLPLVIVRNTQTGRTLKEPILPRGRFRIYVPIRIFKALAAAREVGLGLKRISDAEIRTATDPEAFIKDKVRAIVTAKHIDDQSSDFVFLDNKLKVTIATRTIGTDPITSALITEVDSYEVSLYFEEQNETYRINKNNPSVYGVKLKKGLN